MIRGIEHVLLIYIGETIAAQKALSLESLTRKLKAIRGPAIRIVVISPREVPVPEMVGVSALHDNEESFVLTYGATTGTGYLIRPDGYIAYHARPLTESGLLVYLHEATFLIASNCGA